VGSEVLLIAGVDRPTVFFAATSVWNGLSPRAEWGNSSISAKTISWMFCLGDYNRPRLVNCVFGIGSTASKDEQVNADRPTQAEEIAHPARSRVDQDHFAD